MARSLQDLLKEFVNKNATDLFNLLREADEGGFQRGYAAASAKMQAAFEAALGATQPTILEPPRPAEISTDETKRRAARGSVPRFLNRVMAQVDYVPLDYAGIAKIGENDGIVAASVRNRLREMEVDGHAERDEHDRWSLTEKGRTHLRQVTLASHSMFKHKEAAE